MAGEPSTCTVQRMLIRLRKSPTKPYCRFVCACALVYTACPTHERQGFTCSRCFTILSVWLTASDFVCSSNTYGMQAIPPKSASQTKKKKRKKEKTRRAIQHERFLLTMEPLRRCHTHAHAHAHLPREVKTSQGNSCRFIK